LSQHLSPFWELAFVFVQRGNLTHIVSIEREVEDGEILTATCSVRRAMVALLVNPTKTPIVRHIKVRSNANPFDPNWRSYFETRKGLKKGSSR
jgi:hypothetical protein